MTATATRFASPIDAGIHGVYANAPTRRFTGRVSADGREGVPAQPGRYHLYAGWFCPWSHRATLVRALLGLEDVISVSYVDGLRDGRGWAFREHTGPDPINGFTLLREAYEATEPGYDGAVTVPVLWDRREQRVVTNDPTRLEADLTTAFGAWSTTGIDLYPLARRMQIDELDRWIGPTVNQRLGRAVYDETARAQLLDTLHQLDRRLSGQPYLAGDALTLADVRLWVSLVRYDAGANAHGAIGPKLPTFAHLWEYARQLYALPAFEGTTRMETFTAPFAVLPDWAGTTTSTD